MVLFQRIKILFSADKEYYKAIKNIFGFWPENIFLYKQALRHRSLATQMSNGARLSNERLEFLGDAILDAIVADYMFKKFPLRDEGFLTEMRTKIVSRAQLNKLCQKLGLNQLIIAQYEAHTNYKSINGDAFEAFIGALYLDKGYHFTQQLVINRIINVYFDLNTLVETDFNFKSKLIEWGQKEKKSVVFNVVAEQGANHHKLYVVEVTVDNESIGKGQDHSIKGAEQMAAEKAISYLKENHIFDNSLQLENV